MSHALLFVPNTEPKVASIIYTGDEPWHGFGTKVDSVTATDAMRAIGSDYEIKKVGNVCPHPDEAIDEFVVTSGHTLWRPPLPMYGENNWMEFGQVSEDYVPISTALVAALLDRADDDGYRITDHWPVTTHGICSDGTRVFFSLDGGRFSVGGAECQGFINIRDVKTGKGAFDISVGGVRMVCRNTFDQAGADRWVSADIRHMGDIEHEIRVRLSMIREAQDAMERMKTECQAMSETAITNRDLKKLLEKTYPGKPPTKTFQLAKSLEASGKEELFRKLYGVDLKQYLEAKEGSADDVVILRAGVATAYEEFNDDDKNESHGTAWAFFNSVTGFEDHSHAVRGSDASRAIYKAFGKGSEAKSRAYAACLEMCKN